jgi:hypothetical protein
VSVGHLLALAVVLFIVRFAEAACPPDCVGGGRNPATDCFVEFGGIDATVEACTDGDAACDMDGTVNGVCTFPLSVCLNVAGDPRCTASGLSSSPIVGPARSEVAQALGATLAALNHTQSQCTAPGLAVSLRATLNRVGPAVVHLAITGSAGAKHDRNKLSLTCRPSPASPSFSNTLRPIFSSHCALPACHAAAVGSVEPTLEGPAMYSSLVGVPATNVPTLMRVHPGSIGESYLARKILGKRIVDRTPRMPQGCPTTVPAGGCLTDGEIAAILAWIQSGASDN